MKPKIDWTINLGHLLSFSGALLMVVSVFINFKVEMAMLRRDIDQLREVTRANTTSITDLTTLAAQQHENLAVFIASQQKRKDPLPDNDQ